mgnify:CR=1 FL=1
MHTVQETESFVKLASRLLSEEELKDTIDTVAANLLAGDLIPGTGGFRKIRIAREGGGKSGGYRVIYFFHCNNCPIYLIYVFAKNERSNLTDAQKNALKEVATAIKNAHR